MIVYGNNPDQMPIPMINVENYLVYGFLFLIQDDAGALENEWKFAAMVLDRVCLIAFTSFTVLLSAAVLIAAPHVIVSQIIEKYIDNKSDLKSDHKKQNSNFKLSFHW